MDELKPLLEAFAKASDRTRSIYLILLAFSVVSLAAFINSSDFGWHRSHLQKAKLAYAYFDDNINPASKKVPTLSLDESDEAKEFIQMADIRTSEEAKMMLTNDRRQVADSNVVQVPLFGLAFHRNDLGLVAGISVVLLLLLLKYALIREVENLELVSDKAQLLDKQKIAYEILSSGEVLHRPIPLNKKRNGIFSRPLIDAPVVLLYVPVLSYGLVMADDFKTRNVGLYLSHDYARFILTFECLALSMMVFLAYSCFVIVRETRIFWHKLQYEASTNPPSTGEAASNAV